MEEAPAGLMGVQEPTAQRCRFLPQGGCTRPGISVERVRSRRARIAQNT